MALAQAAGALIDSVQRRFVDLMQDYCIFPQ